MIYSLRGKLIAKETDMAVIECGGVGYGCRATLSTLSRLGRTGEEASLFTYLLVREDAVELFGFFTKEELNCFKMLLSVSGVGPKAAIAILSDISPERFALTVASGDYKPFTKTKGIGPKLAQRIVLELKDKITREQVPSSGGAEFFAAPAAGKQSNISEAICALVVLGYSQSEAMTAVAGADASLEATEIIKLALKKIGSR